MKEKETNLSCKEHFNALKDITGITLVSLIVTIIILLILAGITLGFVFGKNGIIEFAQNAGKNYMKAENEENNTLENSYSSMFIATNDGSQVTINIEDLNKIIDERVEAKILKNGIANPTGCVISQMGNQAPDGYLICNGTVYHIEEYKQLADYINTQFRKYNYWGGGGGTVYGNTNSSSYQDFLSTPNFKSGVMNFDNNNYSISSQYYTARPTNTSVLYCIKY